MENTAKESEIIYENPVITWESEKRFLVSNVAYKGQTGTYRLFEQMTPAMNQEQLTKLYETEKQKGNPHPTDAPLIWAIATKSHELRNQNPEVSEKLRQFFRTGFRKYPNTLTRIAYEPSGKDKIIHNYRTSDEYSIDAEVVGSEGFVQDIPNKKVLEALLGTQDVSQINAVSQWINGTNSFLWRLNSKPSKKDERVAWFVANDNVFLLCLRGSLDGYPAFRVLKVD
jgi:hypothetical protein